MSAKDDVLARFGPVAMDKEQSDRLAFVRQSMRVCASELCDLLPEGRSKALALTKLEESAMWATKAITHAS